MSFIPPSPSLASRQISLTSRGSYRHTLVDASANRIIRCESRLERNFFIILLARRDISELVEQPPAVKFIDDYGRQHLHTFDGLATTTDGVRIAIDIKPAHRVRPSGLLDVHRAIKAQVGAAFADRYVIRTEEHIHPTDVANSSTVLRARRLPDRSADIAVRDLADRLTGWCRLGDLVAASEAGASAFDAVVRLIDEGVLTVREQALISYDCQIGNSARIYLAH